jgi:hypothetical protein
VKYDRLGILCILRILNEAQMMDKGGERDFQKEGQEFAL